MFRRTAQWSQGPEERPRVLIEDPEAEWFDEFERYRSAGFEVAVCTGPDVVGGPCPHLHSRSCPLWEEADAVVFALPRDEPAGRMVLKAGRRAHPGKPIVYETEAGDADRAAGPGRSAAERISAIRNALGK